MCYRHMTCKAALFLHASGTSDFSTMLWINNNNKSYKQNQLRRINCDKKNILIVNGKHVPTTPWVIASSGMSRRSHLTSFTGETK